MKTTVSLNELKKVWLFSCKNCGTEDYLSDKDLDGALIITCDDCGEQHLVTQN